MKFTIPWRRFSIYPLPAALMLPATLLEKTDKLNVSGLVWLMIGVLSHPWVMGSIWDAVEKILNR